MIHDLSREKVVEYKGKLLGWCGLQSTSRSSHQDILTTNDNLQRLWSVSAQLNAPCEKLIHIFERLEPLRPLKSDFESSREQFLYPYF